MRAPGLALLTGAVILAFAGCSRENEASAPERPAAEAPPSRPAEEPRPDTAGEAVTIEDVRAEALKNIDQQGCLDRGGEVRQAGLLGLPRCVTPYGDAGETCRDSADCEGRCLSEDGETDPGAAQGEMKGLCEADDSPFGCYAEIVEGASRGFLCID